MFRLCDQATNGSFHLHSSNPGEFRPCLADKQFRQRTAASNRCRTTACEKANLSDFSIAANYGHPQLVAAHRVFARDPVTGRFQLPGIAGVGKMVEQFGAIQGSFIFADSMRGGVS